MQMLFHIPDTLPADSGWLPPGQRSAFVAKLMEQALPDADDPLYQVALAVEQDSAQNAEMQEWRVA